MELETTSTTKNPMITTDPAEQQPENKLLGALSDRPPAVHPPDLHRTHIRHRHTHTMALAVALTTRG